MSEDSDTTITVQHRRPNRATRLAGFSLLLALLAAVSFVASWIPARRAMRTDPIIALRAE